MSSYQYPPLRRACIAQRNYSNKRMMNSTMHEPSDIERTVMRRVHRAHALRPFVSMGALAAVICAAALWGIGREVWVAHVFQNAPSGTFALGQFYLAAFEHTKTAVQVLVLATLASALVAAVSMLRPVAQVLAPRYA